MFCVQCGNKLEDGANFCAICGTPVNTGESQAPASEKLLTATLSAGTSLLLAIQPVAEWLRRGKYARVLAAFISVLIITTLFFGWVSIHIRLNSFISEDDFISEYLPREIKNILKTNINIIITTHDLTNYARGLESISNVIGTSFFALAEITSALRSASGSLTGFAGFIRFMSMVCVLSFAVFLSLMACNSKKAALAGQAAALSAFLTSFIFVISVSVINSSLPSIVAQGIRVGASGWVYITITLGAAGFLLITLCRRVINEE